MVELVVVVVVFVVIVVIVDFCFLTKCKVQWCQCVFEQF